MSKKKTTSGEPAENPEAAQADSDPADADNGETQTVPKSEFDELQAAFKGRNKEFKTLKAELDALKAQVAASANAGGGSDDPDDDPEDGEGDEGGTTSPPAKPKADKQSRWRDQYYALKEEQKKQDERHKAELEAEKAARRKDKKERLLSDLIAGSEVKKKSHALVQKLISDEFDLDESDGEDALEPKDGSPVSAEKWLSQWLEEYEDFKESPRAKGTGDPDGGAKKERKHTPGGTVTVAQYMQMDKKERIKALRDNPDLQKQVAGGMFKEGRK